MPRVSFQQNALREVRHKLVLNIALQSSSDDDLDSASSVDSIDDMQLSHSDEDFELDSFDDSENIGDLLELEGNPDPLLELYVVMDSTRYLQERALTNKSKEFVTQYFDQLPPLLFRQMTRMDKASFFYLVGLIDDHDVFYSNCPNPQAPVEWQLAVTLDKLGHNGNGSCLNRLIPTWGVSNGSLCNFSTWCLEALEVALKPYLRWPNRIGRRGIASEFLKKGFPGCVGLIDGTYIPLAQRPKESGECYFDRNSRYSINTQVVCDHNSKILFIFTGMPGSYADITCWKKSSLFRKQNDGRLFSRSQYLLGDSGYQTSDHLVCSFKRSETSMDKEDFNTCVAKCRLTNEHCIGVFKSCWHSLKEMRIQLNEKKDNLWLVRWILMCARLHNYVISKNDQWTNDDEPIVFDNDDSSDDDMEELPSLSPIQNVPTQPGSMTLQASVMEYALLFHKQPRGCLYRL